MERVTINDQPVSNRQGLTKVTILWVQDEYEGPMNGLAEYNGEKLWFSRLNTPSIISSTEIPVPYLHVEEKAPEETDVENTYILYRLSEDNLILVTENHLAHCEETGAPINHGDPLRLRRRPQAIRMDTEVAKSLIPEGKEVLEVAKRPMGKLKEFKHKIVPGEITGEFITMIKQSQFVNYSVPRTVEII